MNDRESAWPQVKAWVKGAVRPVDVLDSNPSHAEAEAGAPRSRKDVPMTELLVLALDFMEQLSAPDAKE